MPINRIGMVHVAIAEFLLQHTALHYCCIGYEVSQRGPSIHILHNDDDAEHRWRTMTVSDNTLATYSVDVAGRGSAIRDVLFLLSVIGAIKISDYRPIRRFSRARRVRFLHADYMRITPLGGWLSRRHRMVRPALAAAVQITIWRPWTTPATMCFRYVIRPAVLLLAAVGGLNAVLTRLFSSVN